jgi:hypothetical protein
MGQGARVAMTPREVAEDLRIIDTVDVAIAISPRSL